MEEGEKEEQVETAKIQANSPGEEEEKKVGGEKEQAESKISDETDLQAEAAAKKNETTQKKHDEKRPAFEKERDTKEEVLKGEMAKEPSKRAPVSSFFGEATFALHCSRQRGSMCSCSHVLLHDFTSSQKSCCENGETRNA